MSNLLSLQIIFIFFFLAACLVKSPGSSMSIYAALWSKGSAIRTLHYSSGYIKRVYTLFFVVVLLALAGDFAFGSSYGWPGWLALPVNKIFKVVFSYKEISHLNTNQEPLTTSKPFRREKKRIFIGKDTEQNCSRLRNTTTCISISKIIEQIHLKNTEHSPKATSRGKRFSRSNETTRAPGALLKPRQRVLHGNTAQRALVSAQEGFLRSPSPRRTTRLFLSNTRTSSNYPRTS